MNIIMRVLFCGAVLSAICGCTDKNAELGPKVVEGTTLAIVGRTPTSGVMADSAKNYQKAIATLRKSNPIFDKFIETSGLAELKCEWGVFSMVGIPEFDDDGDPKTLPSFAIAVAFDHDLPKIVAAFKDLAKDEKDVSFSDEKIAGLDCTIIGGDKEMRKLGVDICLASLSKQVLIVTSNKAAMEAQIALYRDGKGESKKLPSEKFGKTGVCHFVIPDVGMIVSRLEKVHSLPLEQADEVIPDGRAVLRGLGCVEFVMNSRDGSSCEIVIAVEAGSPRHAKDIAALVNGSLVPAKAQITKLAKGDADPQSVHLLSIMDSLKVEQQDKKVSVSAFVSAEAMAWFKEQADKGPNAFCKGL